MPAMVQFPFQYQAHQFFRRWAHIPETLAEGDHSETIILEGLHHHGGIPPVIGDFTDIQPFPQLQDELFDETVMHHMRNDRQQDSGTL